MVTNLFNRAFEWGGGTDSMSSIFLIMRCGPAKIVIADIRQFSNGCTDRAHWLHIKNVLHREMELKYDPALLFGFQRNDMCLFRLVSFSLPRRSLYSG